MPLSYGGGIRNPETAEKTFQIGFEKVVLNTAPFQNPELVTQLSNIFGSQSVVVAIDVRKNIFGRYCSYSLSGKVNQKRDPADWAREMEDRGAGEILLTSIDREGTWSGFDLELIQLVAKTVTIPVIAHGGASTVDQIGAAVRQGGASAIALGSMVVFQKKDYGVLVNFPDADDLKRVLK